MESSAGRLATVQIGMFGARSCSSLSFRRAAASRRAWGSCGGGLLGRLGAVGEGTLQLSLGLLGAGLEGSAGLLGRCDLGLERRPQLSLVPRGVLPGLGHLPVSGLAGPGRVLLGVPGPGLCGGHRVVPLLLRGGYPLLRVPPGRGGPCLRGSSGPAAWPPCPAGT